ncbi:TIGR01244 family sulfur transferase [Roseobacter sp. GAI101]|uniref:TIGR01244 family sulfur transferase n=1 Tax=Roseobacter sp. (strain GAI101) TaxID=391589 RepID=UPI000187169E|nr:TIGR01244 family sulfur transferase [Roseobacter sp. GAI101]EEB82484.1 conserved hypothetical protein TIGR01244 [Roseobacter sp. GAI101]
MDIKEISDQFYIAPQITEADFALLRDKGIRSIICNRPDGEDAGQPRFQDLSNKAQKQGIEMRHIPVSGGIFNDESVAEFSNALNILPKPILAYCRTGMRSAALWSLAKAQDMPLSEILSATRNAGYDVKDVVRQATDRGKPTG